VKGTNRTARATGLLVGSALLIAALCGPTAAFAATTPSQFPTPTPAANGWYWPTNRIIKAPAPGWLQFRTWYKLSNKAWHLAWDDLLPAGSPVYSLGYGRVVISRMDISGYGPGGGKGGAMVVRYRTSAGRYFSALYGHVVFDPEKFPVGKLVKPGQVLATLNRYDPPHVHFGIRGGVGFPRPLSSTPDKFENTVSMLMGHTFEYSRNASGTMVPQTYGFKDPADFLITREPWLRVAPAPSRPKTPSSARRGTAFRVSGSIAATGVACSAPVTIIGERRVGSTWVRSGHWHGTSSKATGPAPYSAIVKVSAAGTWRFTTTVPETMDWTAAASTPSRSVVVR